VRRSLRWYCIEYDKKRREAAVCAPSLTSMVRKEATGENEDGEKKKPLELHGGEAF